MKPEPAFTAGLERATAELLKVRKPPSSQLEVHDLIERGLPPNSVEYLVDILTLSEGPAPSRAVVFEKGLGISERTLKRHAAKSPKAQRLSPEQSGRVWKFATILAKATAVFGSREAATRWLAEPAIGLGRKRPIDLLSTIAGTEMVEEFLGRLEYGVYT